MDGMKELVVPYYLGSNFYFKAGRPCCAVGYLINYFIPELMARWKDATEECNEAICNEVVAELAVRIQPRTHEEVFEDLQDLSTAVDITDNQDKRFGQLKIFCEHWDIPIRRLDKPKSNNRSNKRHRRAR